MWPRRRRRGESPLGAARNAIMQNLRTRGDIYLTAKHPAPCTNYQIYKELFTPDEREAIKTLAKRVPSTMYFRQNIWIMLNSKESIKVEFERPVPLPQTFSPMYMYPNRDAHEIRLRQLPAEMAQALQQWSREYIETRDKLYALYTYADRVMAICNTVGHIARLWPSLVLFMDNTNKDGRAAAKVKSPYPAGALVPREDGEWILDPQWAKGAEYDETLAAMLVFPIEMAQSQLVYVSREH